jgi:hypothetical protein
VILIPVVLNRAEVPRADALPDSLKPLVQRQGFRVRSDRWHDDVRALVDAISRRLVETHELGPIEGNPGRLRVLVDEGEWLRLQQQAARARAAKKKR